MIFIWIILGLLAVPVAIALLGLLALGAAIVWSKLTGQA